MSKERKIIISSGIRPLWHLFLASIFYTISFFIILTFFLNFPKSFLEIISFIDLVGKVNILYFTIPSALHFSIITFTHLDVDNKQVKKEYTLGVIKWGFWKKLPELTYVSVFKQSINQNTQYVYDVNLWLKDHKHINVFRTSDLFFEDAFGTGYDIAKTLDIKLLDATEDNSTYWDWVDMNASFAEVIQNHKLLNIES